MTFVPAGPAVKLPPGEVMEKVIGERRYAICNVAGELFAVDGTCPHAGGQLAYGALQDYMLVCPWHAWEFDCRTGEFDFNPEVKLDTFEVKVEGGEILIDPGTDA